MEPLIALGIGLAISLAFAFTCAIIAPSRKRSPGAWFFAGLLFSVFALTIVLALPPADADKARA